MFLSSKQSTVSYNSSIGTVAFFCSDCVPTLDNDTFANINTQLSIMQGEHWIISATSHHKLFFLSHWEVISGFLQQRYKQMSLQSHP